MAGGASASMTPVLASSAFLVGDGSLSHPYEIDSPGAMALMDQLINAAAIDPQTGALYAKENYTLAQDINMSSLTSPWVPMTGFDGTFDGQGHVISHLAIDKSISEDTDPSSYRAAISGLFGDTLPGALIENVQVSNVTVTSADASNASLGVLVGDNAGSIQNVSVQDSSITYTGNGMAFLGGVAGQNEGTITSASSSASVSGDTDAGNGGLVGRNAGGTIENSYASGTVSGDNSTNGGLVGDNDVGTIQVSFASGVVRGTGSDNGGLVGVNNGVSGETGGMIVNTYALGAVQGGSGSLDGGLVAYNFGGQIINSYSAAMVSGADGSQTGALVGDDFNGMWSNAYFDEDTGGSASAEGTALGGTAFASQSSFPGFDFAKVWALDPGSNSGYPYLRMVSPVVPIAGELPEVPSAVLLPVTGLLGLLAWGIWRKQTVAQRP